MTSSNKESKVLDMIIVGEVTYRGFIDFGRSINSFKAYILNSNLVNTSKVNFTWSI